MAKETMDAIRQAEEKAEQRQALSPSALLMAYENKRNNKD